MPSLHGFRDRPEAHGSEPIWTDVRRGFCGTNLPWDPFLTRSALGIQAMPAPGPWRILARTRSEGATLWVRPGHPPIHHEDTAPMAPAANSPSYPKRIISACPLRL